jgi:tetratricopeptide (TPR) repeat protein
MTHAQGHAGRAGSLLAAIATAALLLGAPALAAKPRTPDAAPARGLPDNQLAPLSLKLQAAGDQALANRNTRGAIENYEAALAADPRNRQAYIGLGRASEADGLPGQAIRYYREALEIDPNDLTALELQGLALVERGAKARAEENLERVKLLCKGPCAPADRLTAAIAKGPTAKPDQTAQLEKPTEN